VDFGERLMGAAAQLVEILLELHRVRVGVAGLQSRKRAEQAARDANVRRLEAQIEVVVRQRADALLDARGFASPSLRHADQDTRNRPHAIRPSKTDAGVELSEIFREPERSKAIGHLLFTLGPHPALVYASARSPRSSFAEFVGLTPCLRQRLARTNQTTSARRPKGSGCESHTVPPLSAGSRVHC
jgi:hypothetical protein